MNKMRNKPSEANHWLDRPENIKLLWRSFLVVLALTVLEPQSSGIGGGGFFVRGTDDGAVETIDGRETAPAAATPEWFLDPQGTPVPFMQAVKSGLSVGVPGNMRLAEEAHRRHGKLPWAALFEPAIGYARSGFVTAKTSE